MAGTMLPANTDFLYLNAKKKQAKNNKTQSVIEVIRNSDILYKAPSSQPIYTCDKSCKHKYVLY